MVNGIIFTSMNNSIGISKTFGPYLIASELRKNNISCQVIDYFNYLTINDIKKIAKKMVSIDTKFIGFSSTFFFNTGGEYLNTKYIDIFSKTQKYMKEFFSIFKSINPNILFIYGGKQLDFIYDYDYYKDIDLFVSGPGEYFLPLYLTGKIKVNTKYINFEYNKNNFKFKPLKWDKSDQINKNEYLPIETSRGCLFNCAFCRYTLFSNYTEKDPKTLKLELENNYKEFGITNYIITDSLFNGRYKSTVEKLNIMINLPFKISFSCFGKLTMFVKHLDLREKFLKAGCKYIHFGIETLNNKSLLAVHKHGDTEKQIETLFYLKELWKDKVKMSSGFIAGLPYDNEADIEKWIDFLYSEKNPLYEFHIQPLSIGSKKEKYPSDLACYPDKYGYKIIKDGWVSLTSDMTRFKAIELIKKNRKIKKPFWSISDQLINLGYKKEELENINIYNSKFNQTMKKRKKIIIKKYINKLLD